MSTDDKNINFDDLDDLFDDDELDERLEEDLNNIRSKSEKNVLNTEEDAADSAEDISDEVITADNNGSVENKDKSDTIKRTGSSGNAVRKKSSGNAGKRKKTGSSSHSGNSKKKKKKKSHGAAAGVLESIQDKISSFLYLKKDNFFKFILILALIVVVVILVIVLATHKDSSDATDSVSGTSSVSLSQTSSDSNQNTEAVQQSSVQQSSEQSSTSEQNGTSEQSNTSEADTTLGAADLIGVETDDCTGQAGTKAIEEEMLNTDPGTGWHGNYYGRWYALDENTIYYGGWQDIDGNTYHFDAYGHLDRGWKLIGGQSCYFDDNGVYVPDQDNTKLLAFTFDDGPSENFDGILDLCGQYDARVTFFMIGDQVSRGGEALPYVQNFRCQLGNHSYNHYNMNEKTVEECAENFWDCNLVINQYSVGINANVLRFPYGNITDENLAAVYAPSIYWDVDSLDWQLQDTQQVIDMVLSEISEGNIILMHDRYQCTLEACQYLFPYLIEQGYSLVTVNELAAAKGIELQPGVTYYNFRGFDGTYD